MANLTDPLAAALHGTDPQSLMEYITRQKIYDSRYWKEECFGLTAVNVLEKASGLVTIGGSFGGNSQPTKFLCLTLKLLQIQPSSELIDELIQQDDFKYVRALGAFYKRLTGRPADIYETLEPCLRDYRKLRYRDVNDWKLLHLDEFVHRLLDPERHRHDRRVCGISLPRLPARHALEDEGLLEGPYRSPLRVVVDEPPHHGSLTKYLEYKALEQGSEAARVLWEARETRRKSKEAERHRLGQIRTKKQQRDHDETIQKREDDHGRRQHKKSKRRDRSDGKESRHYGTLFKKSHSSNADHSSTHESSSTRLDYAPNECVPNNQQDSFTDEYWNEQRAKLGLKPLRR